MTLSIYIQVDTYNSSFEDPFIRKNEKPRIINVQGASMVWINMVKVLAAFHPHTIILQKLLHVVYIKQLWYNLLSIDKV